MKKVLMVGLLSVTSSAYSTEVLIDFNDMEQSYGMSELTIQNVTFSTNNFFEVVEFGDRSFSDIDNVGEFQNNFLVIADARQPFRFNFENSISSFSFDMVGAGSVAQPDNWQLEVFNALDEQLGYTLWTYGFVNNGFSSPITNIAYATLTSVNGGASGNAVLIDNFKYTEVSPVPEPSTYALMIGGLGLVGFMAYRRKKVQSSH